MRNLPIRFCGRAIRAAALRGLRAGVLVASQLGAASAGGQVVPLKQVSKIVSHARRELIENSAAAMSAKQPGIFFTINDSNNEPLLFAMDTTGADRGVWRVLGSTNVDWESAAIGPCGLAANAGRPAPGVPSCVYIGDTGDNKAKHSTRRIYRVEEPTALAAGASGALRPERITYVYTDGPHDVEAMYAAPNGDIYLITKRPLADLGSQRRRPALVFRLPAAAWSLPGTSIARLVDSLPIVPGSQLGDLVTDASLSHDGRHLAVRTYAQVYLFGTDSLTGAINHAVPPRVCDLVKLHERHGEGVTWADDRGRLLFTSEGLGSPIHLGDCPLP